jgi:hypothetical protein
MKKMRRLSRKKPLDKDRTGDLVLTMDALYQQLYGKLTKYSECFFKDAFLLKKPLARIELATSSLPWTRSTN